MNAIRPTATCTPAASVSAAPATARSGARTVATRTVATLAAMSAAAVALSGCGPMTSTSAAPAPSSASGTTAPVSSSVAAPSSTAVATQTSAPTVAATPSAAPVVLTPPATTVAPTATVTPTVKPSVKPSVKPATKPSTTPKPAVPASPVLWERGDSGAKVREVQARLRQIGWYSGDVVDSYGPKTQEAVSGFQAKRGLPVTGSVDQRTWDKLVAMTRKPTADELANVKPKPKTTNPPASTLDLDERCMTGRVMCVSKTTRQLTWMIDGQVQFTLAARFGPASEPTREGVFPVSWKKVDVISTIYHTPMPYSMFFSGGQAVHYSNSFATNGYNGNSHGCINIRDYAGIQRLYGEVNVGDKVIVHW